MAAVLLGAAWSSISSIQQQTMGLNVTRDRPLDSILSAPMPQMEKVHITPSKLCPKSKTQPSYFKPPNLQPHSPKTRHKHPFRPNQAGFGPPRPCLVALRKIFEKTSFYI